MKFLITGQTIADFAADKMVLSFFAGHQSAIR